MTEPGARGRTETARIPRFPMRTLPQRGPSPRQGLGRAIVETARELGIPYLSLFAFSSENWTRPSTEVNFLMGLLRRYLLTETKRLMKREIRVIAVGDLERLPAPVREALSHAVDLTSQNRTMRTTTAAPGAGLTCP